MRKTFRGGYALNPYKDGTVRTIKYQYQKNGISNFLAKDSFGATGVIRKRKVAKDGTGC